MRRARILLALALVAATPLRAQHTLHLHRVMSDSAVGLLSGRTNLVPVSFGSNQNVGTSYLSATIYYDPARLTIQGAQSGRLNLDSAVVTPGVVRVYGGGMTDSSDGALYYLKAQLTDPNGTYLRIEPDSMLDQYGSDGAPTVSTLMGLMCHASVEYGDIDRSGGLTSRDALIALSEAVGLNVGAYSADVGPLGDVDVDSVVTSRDALAMLTTIVFGNPPFGTRLSSGMPDACPGTTGTAPRDIIFVRDTSQGRTMMILPQGSSSPVIVPDPATQFAANYPRLAADGISIVYQCVNTSYFYSLQTCTINADGSNKYFQTPTMGSNSAPDWSPGVATFLGYPVTFSNGGYLDVLIGSCSIFICPSLTNVGFGQFPAWSFDSTSIAYRGSGGIRVVAPDGTGDHGLSGLSSFSSITRLRWNNASDSIAFYNSAYYYQPRQGLYVMSSSSGGAPKRVTAMSLNPIGDEGFDWGAPGFVFTYPRAGMRGIWILPASGGLPIRLTANTDREASFRRFY